MRYGYDELGYRPRRDEGPSWLGIASVGLGAVTGVVVFIAIAVAGILETSTPGGLKDDSPEAILVGLFVIGGLLLCLVGAALGVGGLVERRKSKVFPVLGITLNGLIVLGTLALMCVGLLTQ